jgi:hypothetical protein
MSKNKEQSRVTKTHGRGKVGGEVVAEESGGRKGK